MKVVGNIFIIEVHLVILLLSSVQPADKHPKFMEVEVQQYVRILRFELVTRWVYTAFWNLHWKNCMYIATD